MKNKHIIAIALINLMVVANPALAARSEKKQDLVEAGTFTGITAVATVAAGPVGLIIGSITGAFLADQTKKANERAIALDENAHKQENLMTKLKQQELKVDTLVSEQVKKLSLQILFSTGKDNLTEVDLARIEKLAGYLADNPQLSINLEGHSDPRGTDEYNNVLSIERAKSIKDALISLGIDESRIQHAGAGSSVSASKPGDLEAYRLERRVEIEVGNFDSKASLANF